MNKYLFCCFLFLSLISCSGHRKASENKTAADHLCSTGEQKNLISALSIPTEQLGANTGIQTLENGGESLIARLWLIGHAQKKIDIQYYSFAKDHTGLIVSAYLVCAADRGVKIRILIDDAAARMYSHEIQLLDAHDNIEIRVYNAGLMLGRADRRIYKMLGNSNRLLRRMHNKALIIDEILTITGGRNIADEYFDYDDKFNFRDRDVLLIGKAVKEVTTSFDAFWSHKLTEQYSELSGKRKQINKKKQQRFGRLQHHAIEKLYPGLKKRIDTYPELFSSAQKSGQLNWAAQTLYISDEPGKNEDRKGRKGSICKDSLVSLLRQAKKNVVIQSPYFILSEGDLELLHETISRGVRVRLLTNSLASIDNIEAFSGYQKDREAILKSGVELYEFKPDAAVRLKLMIPDVQAGLNYKPVYGLHSKTIIIDDQISVIGSYNFDPRSANYNTECITVIRSPEVAKDLSEFVEEEFLEANAWRVVSGKNPDRKAGVKKNIKAFTRRIIPKKLL